MVETAHKAVPLPVQIICPVYNEGENIRTLYRQLASDGVPFDTLNFIYDFDEDSTLPVVAELKSVDSRVSAQKNDFGRGVVHALRWGFAHAEPGPLIVVMGDNSDKLSIIPEMIALWRSGATIVSPSRYMRGGRQFGGGLLKSTLSRIAGMSLKICGFPTADPTNNYKLYDGAWVSQQHIESTGGFEIALELTYKAYIQRLKIVEVPTVWRDRTLGQSKFNLRKWLPLYLRWYLKAVRAALFTRPESPTPRA